MLKLYRFDCMTTKTIWKYPLLLTDEQAVQMPKGAEILCVQVQGSRPCLWALVDSSVKNDERLIVIYGTGHPMPEAHNAYRRQYIGTAQMNDGSLVWHVFEII